MPLRTIILILPLLLLSSCFEFIEEVNYTGEHNGNCVLTLNCSQSRIKLKNLIKLDTFMGLNLPGIDKVKADIAKAEKLVAQIPGISLVSSESDFENFIFTFKFSFDSTEALNLALNKIAAVESERHPLPFYTVYRSNSTEFERLKLPDDSVANNAQVKDKLGWFSGATATSIYRFTKTVSSVSNKKALISKNKKAVMLKQSIIDIVKKPEIFSNIIQLK